MGRANLGATVVRARSRERRLWSVRPGHIVTPRDEGLRLGVERVVPVIASGDRMLRFRVMGVHVRRQLPICVGYTGVWWLTNRRLAQLGKRLSHRHGAHLCRGACARRSGGIRCGGVSWLPAVRRLNRAWASI